MKKEIGSPLGHRLRCRYLSLAFRPVDTLSLRRERAWERDGPLFKAKEGTGRFSKKPADKRDVPHGTLKVTGPSAVLGFVLDKCSREAFWPKTFNPSGIEVGPAAACCVEKISAAL